MLDKWMNQIIQGDCLELMKQLPDKCIDLVLTDPPYSIDGIQKRGVGGRFDMSGKICEWNNNKPTQEYFDEIFRISKYQIIWGANNFTLPETEYFLVWDKMQTVDNFASAEYAWTNIKMPAKVFRYAMHKEMQVRKSHSKNGKLHPTQKPLCLGEWIIDKYAKEDWVICDPYAGSGTFLAAAQNKGHNFIGFELDEEYCKIARERTNYIRQGLF